MNISTTLMGLFYIRELCKQEASMATMTIRGLDDLTIKALKEKAKQEGTSVNATLVKLLKEDLGLKKKKRMLVYNDLDQLAGTWSAKEYEEFQKIMKNFETIDETIWR
jgi:plasmid stability protein